MVSSGGTGVTSSNLGEKSDGTIFSQSSLVRRKGRVKKDFESRFSTLGRKGDALIPLEEILVAEKTPSIGDMD